MDTRNQRQGRIQLAAPSRRRPPGERQEMLMDEEGRYAPFHPDRPAWDYFANQPAPITPTARPRRRPRINIDPSYREPANAMGSERTRRVIARMMAR